MENNKEGRKKEKESKIDLEIKKLFPLVGGLVLLLVVFVVLYYLFQGVGKIDYEGLTFTKQKYGELVVYAYDYLAENSEGKIMQNTLFVRTDPRENKVPVEGTIAYPEGKTVMISINSTGLNECENSMIAISTLTNFLVANSMPIKGGTPDKNESIEKNMTYITCGKYPTNTVILIKAADATGIRQVGAYCYVIDVANCEIQEAVEKFAVQSIIDSKEK